MVATVAAALVGATAVLHAALDGAEQPTTAAATAAVAVAGVALAIAAAGRFPERTTGAVLLVSLPPVLLAATTLSRGPGAAVAGGTALVLLAVAAVPRIRDAGLAQVALAATAVAGLEATALALRGTTLTVVLLGQAVVLALLAVRAGAGPWAEREGSAGPSSRWNALPAAGRTGRGPLVAAAAYGVVGVGFALARDLPPEAITAFGDGRLTPRVAGVVVRDVPALVGAVAVSVLLVALAGSLLAAVTRPGMLHTRQDAPFLVTGLGLLGLYGAAGLVVTLALFVSPTRAGFLTGHVLVTVSWTVLALVLLVRGLRDSTPRVLGGVLVVAAVLKLVFFDLTALDGIARVAAFLGAGLVLLLAGTRYARLVAEAESEA